MPGVARVGQDTAGGTQLGSQAPTVFVNGSVIVVLGDLVAAHGVPPHSPMPTMAAASTTVFAGGIGVCRQGDAASCGHPSTGSGNVFAGG